MIGFRFACIGSLTTVAILIAAGCSGDPRCAIEGNVNLDGKPMERGLVTLIPQTGTKGRKASGAIIDGVYHIEKKDGPNAGDFLVKIETVPHEIEAIAEKRPLSREDLRDLPPRPEVAPEFNRDSTTIVTVRLGDINQINFEVESVQATHKEKKR